MTDTAPWSSLIPGLAVSGYVSTFTVDAIIGRTTTHRLAVTRCVVTVDGARSPRWSATLTAAFPPRDIRARLDPRKGLEVDIRAGYILGTLVDDQALCRLNVLDVETDHVAQTVTITAVGDEDVVIYYPAESAYAYSAGDPIVTAVQAVVADCFPGTTLTWDVTAVPSGTVFATAQRIEIGEDRWEAVTDWLEGYGLKLYHDGAQTWWIGKPPRLPGVKAAARFRVGPKGNVTALQVAESRAGWGNKVAIVWEYKSATSAATVTTTAAVASAQLSPPRMLVVKRKRKPDRPRDVAEAALDRAMRRGNTVRLRGPSYLWVRPWHTVTVDLPDGDQLRLLVESVAFDLAAGTMELAGQKPPTTYVPSSTST